MTDFNKIHYRAVIKFLTLENVQPQQIHSCMTVVYGENAPSYTTVKRWTTAAHWQLKRSGEESCPRCRYFCTTMHLLIGRMLDRLHFLNPDLKKCAIQHILQIWHQ